MSKDIAGGVLALRLRLSFQIEVEMAQMLPFTRFWILPIGEQPRIYQEMTSQIDFFGFFLFFFSKVHEHAGGWLGIM